MTDAERDAALDLIRRDRLRRMALRTRTQPAPEPNTRALLCAAADHARWKAIVARLGRHDNED